MPCSLYRTISDMDLRDLDAFGHRRTHPEFPARGAGAARLGFRSQPAAARSGRLGVRLMSRTTHSVGLTEAGELLLARIGPAMSDVAASESKRTRVRCSGGELFCCARFALIKRARSEG
jgi:DNA-binding transcriptional LysR family regulator